MADENQSIAPGGDAGCPRQLRWHCLAVADAVAAAVRCELRAAAPLKGCFNGAVGRHVQPRLPALHARSSAGNELGEI
eukprot:6192316-Pleurochrysis_carterae.AAC.3